MSENLTALASENLNPSLRSLLEDVQRGHIRVPRFQRPFVWNDGQRLELLRSILFNVPIGSLLVWRTSRCRLACFPSVGPHAIPKAAPEAPATGWQYLLDGHQRVSTLLGLLLPIAEKSLADDDDIDWDIQYDLQEGEFVFGAKTAKRMARPLLPLSTLFDGRLVSRHMRELRKQAKTEGWTDESLNTWDDRADHLSYRFQQYRIPIVVMVTEDLSLAVWAFERINTTGTPMDEANLVAAMTWTPNFDLRERIDELRGGLPQSFRDLTDRLFLQVCKGLAGLDMTRPGQAELARKLVQDPSLLQRAGEGLARAAEWLGKNALVVRLELLPYAFQLVLLAVELDRWKDTPEADPALRSWFWRTCWSEIFASATYRQVQLEQLRLKEAVSGAPSPPWAREQSLPERFDFRAARVKLLTLRLAARVDFVDAKEQHVHGDDLLVTHGREALVRLFPTQRKASAQLKRLLLGAGNRFFIDPSEDAVFRDRLRNGPDLSAEALNAHFVDKEALAALRAGALETFLGRRASAVNAWDFAEWNNERRAAGDLTP